MYYLDNKDNSYKDLLIIKNMLYDPCGFECSLVIEPHESIAYSACSFELNNLKIVFRTVKITPKKIGQFVVL